MTVVVKGIRRILNKRVTTLLMFALENKNG